MERVTISLDDDLRPQFDNYLERKGYVNRSEGVRDLLRERLEGDRLSQDQAKDAVATLSFVYNREQRELTRRLAKSHHAHLDLVLSTLHVHLDRENCLEVSVLKGRTPDARAFAEATIAETGVRCGNLHLTPSYTTRWDTIRARSLNDALRSCLRSRQMRCEASAPSGKRGEAREPDHHGPPMTREAAKISSPTSPPTSVPLIRMYWRSLPT